MEKRAAHLAMLLVGALAFFTVEAGWWSPSPAFKNGEDRLTPKTLAQGHPAQPAGASQDDQTPPPESAPPDRSPPLASKADPLTAFLRQRLDSPGVVPGEALLSFRNQEDLNRFAEQAGTHGLGVLGTIPQLNALRIHYGSIDQLRDALAAANPANVSVEGNPWLSVPPLPQPDPNNQHGATPFGYSTMNAINAGGDRTQWGNNVTVAVLDTGVLAHPTFGTNQVTHLDLVNDGQPFDSHGTSVASLIAGQDPQAPGVAPGAQILDVRVAGSQGYTVGSLLAQGIVTATDRGAQVINISLGGYGDSPVLDQSLNYAFQHGVLVVAAAGNEAYNQLAMPAAYPGVISVGSIDASGEQAYFSNSGQGLTLTAPGVGVMTAWSTNQIALASGTSQSSALVSGATAAYLGWGVQSGNVTARLKTDAQPTGAPADQVGAGMLMIKPPAGR
jgi:thermitase